MTPEEKLKRLLEMQEHPERYTEEEILQMMADKECRQLYEQMVRATDAMFEAKQFDNVECNTHNTQPSKLFKIAAIFIGVLLFSGITYAAIHYVRNSIFDQSPSQVEKVGNTANSSLSNPQSQLAAQDSTLLKPVVFEDAELVNILKEVAAYYHYETVYKRDDVKHIRLYFTWDKSMPVEATVEMFNKFERIHITLKDTQMIIE